MKKGLPIIWRYLLALAATAALTFVIAQNDATAQVASGYPDYMAPGSFPVQTSDAIWRDAVRKRDVPVRIYAPDTKSKATEADIARSSRFPVILFSHGLGGNRAGGAIWAGHWASHGYLVVAIQHGGSDESLWKDRPPQDLKQNMKSGMTLSNLGLRVGDVRFVIDEVTRRAADKEAPFSDADPKRLGMSGHSFGAQTTFAIAGQKAGILGGQSGLDPRVAAAIAFSPNARNKLNVARQFGDIRIPLFSITGTQDGSILGDGTRYQDRMLPFGNMPAGSKYLVVFDGGDHMVFGGHELGARRPVTARDREIQSDVKAATLAFWNAMLKKDARARQWLDADGDAVSFRATLDAKDTFAAK